MSATGSTRTLLADIGGTHARFALFDPAVGLSGEAVLAVADFADPLAAVASYLAAHEPVLLSAAALAIAAPVDGDPVELTNGGWRFSRATLANGLGLPPENLLLVNDFAALALALPWLATSELRQVGGGQVLAEAPKALLGPGTGLGVSGLVKAGDDWVALSGEGGHVSLAPADAREAEILALARRQLATESNESTVSPHVSAERLVSGSGLPLLHRLVGAVDGLPTATLATLTTPEIVRGALAGDTACRATIDTFCALLGSVAGNLALTLGARGGVYIGGGIVPRLGALFDDSPFRARFEAKGRFASYLAAIPVHVILAASPALRGAAEALRRK